MREEVQENVASLENAKSLADKIKELSSEDPSINKDLDEQVEKVETPLNELVSALNARQSELQTALLQSQELRESVDELSSWLTAAENLLNIQGPLSARHKVIVDQQDKLQVSYLLMRSSRYYKHLTVFGLNKIPYLKTLNHLIPIVTCTSFNTSNVHALTEEKKGNFDQ